MHAVPKSPDAYRSYGAGSAGRDEIIDYYGQGSYAADRFIRQVNEAFAQLSAFPGSASRRPLLTALDVRFFLIKPHSMVVRQQGEVLVVLAILHASRDIGSELRARSGRKQI